MRFYKFMVIAVSIAAITLGAYLAFSILPGPNPLKPIAEKLRSYVYPMPDTGSRTPPSSGLDENAPKGPSGRPGAQDDSGSNPGSTGSPSGRSGITGNEAADQDKYYMTFNEVNALEKISPQSKFLFISAATKLDRADVDRIIAMAEDGVTYGEMHEIRCILEKKLNSAEIKKIEGILSQSKKLYDEGELVKR